ncbi:MAG: hypothetical protein KTR28_05460 [Micavibrio sp.]|nr:hypothetical protein [Micavibrio sp.]
MLKKNKNSKQSSNASARIVDGKLILSLPDAETPVVWQMDLTQSKASALEVRKDDEGKIFTLTLKTPKGDLVEIAPFISKEYAVEGLMAASSALGNAHGAIRAPNESVADGASVSYNIGQKKKSGLGKKLLIIFGVIFTLVILLMLWSATAPKLPASGYPQQYGAASAPSAPPANQRIGEAVSADDFLGRQ